MIVPFLMMAMLKVAFGQEAGGDVWIADKAQLCVISYDDVLYKRVKQIVKNSPIRTIDWRKYDFENPSLGVNNQNIDILVKEMHPAPNKGALTFWVKIENCGKGRVTATEQDLSKPISYNDEVM